MICVAVRLMLTTPALLAGQSPTMRPPAAPAQGMQPPAEETPEMVSPAAPPADLSGPTLPESAMRSLVHFNARGELIRLDTLPEIVALDLLHLGPERRRQTWPIIEAHRDAIVALLIDEIDLLKDATDAQKAGDNQKVQIIYRQLYGIFNPQRERDQLITPLSAVLTEPERADLARLVDEYWSAWIGWELRQRPDADEAQRAEVQNRLAFGIFQRQIAQGYQASLRIYQSKLESICSLTEATDEQRAHLREIVIEFIRETRLSPTADQRAALARQVYDALDEDRRVKLMEYALSRL